MNASAQTQSQPARRTFPEKESIIRGLPTRCGCVLDLAWSEGRRVSASSAPHDTSLTVRYVGRTAPIRLTKGMYLEIEQ